MNRSIAYGASARTFLSVRPTNRVSFAEKAPETSPFISPMRQKNGFSRCPPTPLRFVDKWHLDEVVITINGKKHWLWRAVNLHGFVLDVLAQP
jgi:hypothetical protein